MAQALCDRCKQQQSCPNSKGKEILKPESILRYLKDVGELTAPINDPFDAVVPSCKYDEDHHRQDHLKNTVSPNGKVFSGIRAEKASRTNLTSDSIAGH